MNKFIYCLALMTIISCVKKNSESLYYRDLGDILYNKKLDNKDFKICHEDVAVQFNRTNGLNIEGEKVAIVKYFKDFYKIQNLKGQDGYISIRFIVNCEGETGRFRSKTFGYDLKERKFDKVIEREILNTIKKIKGWKPYKYKNYSIDYYQYLCFKLKNGQIIDILP